MPTELKKQTVETLEKQAKESTGLIVTAFKGLKTTEINEFRQKLRALKGEYRVVKNSLTRIAFKNAGIESLADALKGPSAIVIERGDPIATLKAVFEFAKSHENMKVSAGYLDGKVLSDKELKILSNLPSREVLIAQLLGTLQTPMVNLVSVLQAPMRDLVGVLDQIAKKAPAAA
ncbi:MAG: 50S ribosomal protein L10 [Elusimicrobia bacterium RIFCSPLOWO2_01_FULL_59_12]|nr:MAG: 50S ribosomal protein L10 [Elusimicrobia bacterium RIFCSPLOWO2_01_FULL_59_12]